jgi:class 3 adenylate cyclase
LLETILDKASRLTDSPKASVILLDAERDVLYIAHATGEGAAAVMEGWGAASERGIPLEGSKAGEVFRSGRAIVDDAVAAAPNHFKGIDHDTNTSTESMVCVPLAVAGDRLGVVQLLNKRTGNYTERDVTLLEHFAAQAAVAIRNAQLFDDLLAHMGFYTSGADATDPMSLLDELTQPARWENMTILFADMRGFTQLCHMTRAEQTQELLNEFLSLLAAAVVDSRGIVNKFLGDGLMALFRGDDHALRGVQAAFAMLAGFAELQTHWDKRTNVPAGLIDVGIGIATDDVILGSMGSDKVRDFTAVGSGVNLAAYLMEEARNGRRILVDKKTYYLVQEQVGEVDGPEAFEFKKPGQVGYPSERFHLKSLQDGRAQPDQRRPAAPPRESANDVFVSYSHQDRKWLEKLQVHLSPYVRAGAVTIWDDTRLKGGDLWREEIERALAAAKVAVLLVSPYFLQSEFVAASELPPLLASAKDKGLKILWVPLSASSFDETEIGRFQAAAAIDPRRPLDTMTEGEQNQAWVAVCKEIKAATRT